MTDMPTPPTEQDILSAFPFVAASEQQPHDFGVLANGAFYLWNVRITPIARRIEHLARAMDRAIGIILASAIVVLLLVSVALRWFWYELPHDSDILLALFSSPTQKAHMAFWMAAALGLILIYRAARARRAPNETGTMAVTPVTIEPTTWEQAPHGAARVAIGDRMTQNAWQALDDAAQLAEHSRHELIGAWHLFAGALSQSYVSHVLMRLGLTLDALKDPLVRKLGEVLPAQGAAAVAFAPDGQQIVLGAMVHALMHGRTIVSSVDIFVSAYRQSAYLQEVFYAAGIENEAMENVLEWLAIRERLRARWHSFARAGFLKPKHGMNRAMTAVATPMLDRLSEDVTAAAARGGLEMLIGRDDELARVLRVFEGGGRSVVLVGPRGVGKSAIIDGLAERMVREDVPDMLKDRRLVRLDIGRLVAGATPAQAEERLLIALTEIARSRNIALVIPDIDDIVGISAGGAESLDLSSLLATEMERGYFVAIATTTPAAYASALEGRALGNALTKIIIDEPTRTQAIHVVAGKVGAAEGQHHVVFSYAAVEAAVELTGRYVHDAALPEKALRVVDESALYARQQRGTGAVVSREDVAHVVSGAVKIPLTQVTQDEKEKLLALEARLHERVIGQDEAVNMVAAALRRARTQMRSGKRPIANFLFLGPTGVGKTELAKTIAESYFGSEEAMIRLDMSEYQEVSALSRLLGVAGSGTGGVFTEAVRKAPFALVLLDELEKAHPDILNVFLQVFDDGRLTDAAGRTIDFTQTIIVATSNVGARYIQEAMRQGVAMEQIKTHLIEEELTSAYRPEFLNRFDGVVVFSPLSPEHVRAIAQLMLRAVAARLEEQGMVLRVTDAAMTELATAGYDPQFGARPLRRVIQERVEDRVATLLLESGAERRDTIVLEAGREVRVEKAKAL